MELHPNLHIPSMIVKTIELLNFEDAWDLLLNLMQDNASQVRDQAARCLVTISKEIT